jgi:bifunctional enzyme CysN/CysC/sulfate adenylyltransferase subunit 1
MNAIGVLRIEAARTLYFDPYTQNRASGCFVLIDATTNATVGAGMILAAVVAEGTQRRTAIELKHDRVTPVERIARYRHSGETVSLGARPELAWLLERKLFDRGCAVTVVEGASEETLNALEGAGLLMLLVSSSAPDWDLPEEDDAAASFVVSTLEETGVLLPAESLTGGEGI